MRILVCAVLATAATAAAGPPPCSLNGQGTPCRCDQGWTGAACGQLDLAPAPPLSQQIAGIG